MMKILLVIVATLFCTSVKGHSTLPREFMTMMISFVIIATLVSTSVEGQSTLPQEYDAIRHLVSGLGAEVPAGDPCGGTPWPGVKCMLNGDAYSITNIDRSDARLNGSIGTDIIGQLRSLTSMNLGHNEIVGGFPSALPSTLQHLSLSHNNLSGPIPDSLDDLTDLRTLDISGNFLTGPLPRSLGSMRMLTTLYMQDNRLAGSLETLKNLTLLTTLNIQNNMFTGQVPDELLNRKNFSCIGCPKARKNNFLVLIIGISSIIAVVGVVSRRIYNNINHVAMGPGGEIELAVR